SAATVLAACTYVLSQPASAQDFASDYRSLVSLEKEFGQVLEDVGTSLRGMTNKLSVEFECLETSLWSVNGLEETFAQYKFSVAILDVIKDQADRKAGIELLKIQTNLVKDELQTHRKGLNRNLGVCSKFPLVVAKGTELLTVIKKAEAVVK